MIDTALAVGNLGGLLAAVSDSIRERIEWEIWLHGFMNMTFSDFVRMAHRKDRIEEAKSLPEDAQISIINQSLAIAGLSFS